jgi:GxxExxY protein
MRDRGSSPPRAGLLESAYRSCLIYELTGRGHIVRTEAEISLKYKELELPCAYRADLVVNQHVVVEIKAVDKLLPVHEAQLLT